ncbi:hypothetical protein RchiOBHm_Chr1g0315501 [Rosa chinensis]|uniref:Uncharacterized protein n=1 Tax=Rosa chinensis TaxID=74649 RepID=A0A2P6S7D8_ROSCH|nr:hypothetical protein RchiOBHm_Chr1g0315501 [Rosa chinensis]
MLVRARCSQVCCHFVFHSLLIIQINQCEREASEHRKSLDYRIHNHCSKGIPSRITIICFTRFLIYTQNDVGRKPPDSNCLKFLTKTTQVEESAGLFSFVLLVRKLDLGKQF